MMLLITGASGGIGNFLCGHYASKGHKVFGTYYASHPSAIDGVQFNKVNVSDPTSVEKWVNAINFEGEKVILLNSAGISYSAFGHKADVAKWREVIDVNLIGSYYTSRYILPVMRESGFGRIINFSSVVAQIGIHGTSAYAASKAALWGLTKTLAVENAAKNITVNTITLGYFNIGMINDVPSEMKADILTKIPKKEFGNPRNIIQAIDFLVDSDYTNGESININGALY